MGTLNSNPELIANSSRPVTETLVTTRDIQLLAAALMARRPTLMGVNKLLGHQTRRFTANSPDRLPLAVPTDSNRHISRRAAAIQTPAMAARPTADPMGGTLTITGVVRPT